MIPHLPYAGITRIRYKGLISARSIKAPQFDTAKIQTLLGLY